jgi:hypothetical protein
VNVGARPDRGAVTAYFGSSPYAPAAKEQSLDDWGRDFFTDEIGEGVAPSKFISQVKRLINDACQANAYAAFLNIR